jgi:serine/threonine protein kinase
MYIYDRTHSPQANILINEDWSACLADFGLSIFSDVTSSMSTNRRGSLYWMAPELLDPDRFGTKFIRTPATDVYAFGCVCLEVTDIVLYIYCSEYA